MALNTVDTDASDVEMASGTPAQAMTPNRWAAALATSGGSGSSFIFVRSDEDHGPELWVSDGTGAAPRLLRDIWPGPHGADIANMTRLADGRALFTAQDPDHGYELWVTDGTADGTSLLYDINDGSGTEGPAMFTALADGRVAFVASNAAHGKEIWVTDGTRDGTNLMLEMTSGAEGTRFYGPIHAWPDGRFVFSTLESTTGPATKATLWVSNGTAEGTVALSDLREQSVMLADGRLFLDNGSHITVTDGTPEGTRIMEGTPGTDGARLLNPIGEDGILFRIIAEGASATNATARDAVSYFVTDGTSTHLLLKVDLTANLSNAVHDLGDGKTLFKVTVDGAEQIIVTDGSAEGTGTLLFGQEASQVGNVASLGDGRALIIKGYSEETRSLLLVDGMGTTEILSGSDVPRNLSADSVTKLADGSFIFQEAAWGISDAVIWRTDLTAEGTHVAPELAGIQLGKNFLELGTAPVVPETPTDPQPPTLPQHDWSSVLPLFDVAYYLKNNGDVAASGVDPLQHFLQFGAAEGRDPNSHFDISFYLNQNPDVLAAGVSAFDHYMASGWKEGRDASFSFDGAAYLTANDDVVREGLNPLLHYLLHGEAEGRDAIQATPHATGAQNPLVDATFYYATYTDVAKEGVDATQHYMDFGWQEGRDANAFFDTDWYLARYDDVQKAGVNPLEHYLQFGAAEHRGPSAAFDGDAYLARHDDVAQAGLNPLAHYIQHGQFEGRDIFPA